MKTAKDIIQEIKDLPEEKKQKAAAYLNADEEEEFLEESYSEEDIARILQAGEEARQGINVVGPFEGEEAIEYLRKLRKSG